MAEPRIYSIEELLAFCEKHRIRKIKAGPMEIEMDATAFQVPAPDLSAMQLRPVPKTDMDFLAMGIQDEMFDPETVKAKEQV